jgi:formate C-acetyltransferase
MKTGNAEPLASFRGLCTAFVQQVRWLVGEAIKVNEALGRAHQAIYPTPILSALFEGPMEKGLDLIDGGATLNASGVAIIGLADTADSLSAIRKVVFEEEEITLPDLVKAIREDFPEKEPLAARLMNPDKTPKWGREDQVGDKSVRFIVALLNSIFVRRTNYRGGAYRVGYWSMTNHAGFGRLTGALPSGRRAGKSFASGFTPVSGVAKNLTSALNSVAAVPAKTLRNGVAFNLKFTPALGDPKGKNLLLGFAQTVEGYFGGQNGGTGGMEIQFNVMRSDELAKAKDHPELLVRVSGYTAYFKDLTPEMQAEIIGRTEYQLSAGLATTPVVIQLPSARVASC